MTSFNVRRSITRGWLAALLLAGFGLVLFAGTYVYEQFHPAPSLSPSAPNAEQIKQRNAQDARHEQLYHEQQVLDAAIQETRPRLEARQTAIHAEESSLLDVQAHIANERQLLNTNNPQATAQFNRLVQEFNRRRTVLQRQDKALAHQVAELNGHIQRRNQVVDALSAMDTKP